MTDLPISINNSTPAPASASPASSENSAQADGQDFSNVLARQVADKEKPAQSGSATKSTGNQADTQENAENAAASTVSEPPADMLAILMAQQIQSATAPADSNTASLQNNAQTAPDMASLIMKDNPATQAALGNQAGSGNKINQARDADMLTFEAMPDQPEKSAPGRKFMPDTSRAITNREADLLMNKPSPKGGFSGELSNTMQQALIPSALPGTAQASNPAAISTAITQPAWGDEFSQKITWMATQRNQSAELHLNPPQLGPLDVTLKMNGDQATAVFTSPHAAVREAIEQAMPRLREMLADSGIMLGNAMVSDQPARHHPDQSTHKSQGKSQNSTDAIVTNSPDLAEPRVLHIKRHNGMVDTFA